MKKLLAVLSCVCGLVATTAHAEVPVRAAVPPVSAEPASNDPSSPDPRPSATAKPEPANESPPESPITSTVTPLTLIPESLWNRIRNGFARPVMDSPPFARHDSWFLNHAGYV